MVYPIKVIDIELSDPVNSISGLEAFEDARLMLRFLGRPIGYITAPVTNGCVNGKLLNALIFSKHAITILRCAFENELTLHIQNHKFKTGNLPGQPQKHSITDFPLVTVAICTRNRTADLEICLNAISRLEYANLDVLIIDNAPSDNSTRLLSENKFPQFRYIKEARPGLDWARNRAIIEARGEIIAYTDDDVIVDVNWISKLAELFTGNPEVMAVTGLVVPYELETKAQVLFEEYGGFGRGFERKWFMTDAKKVPWYYLGTGQFGTGANMAYRRHIFEEIGFFDPALDVGTVTNGGGDLEMFFRVLKKGHTLVYEPAAFVRHRHRKNYAELRYQLANNSKGFFSYCIRSMRAYPEERSSFKKLWRWWIYKWILRRLVKSFLGKLNIPRDLIMAEIQGVYKSFSLYSKARKSAVSISKQFEAEPEIKSDYSQIQISQNNFEKKTGTAIRLIDINESLKPLTDTTGYPKTKIFIKWKKWFLGYIDIYNYYRPMTRTRLINAITQSKGLILFSDAFHEKKNMSGLSDLQELYSRWNKVDDITEQLPVEIPVSVVVATFDRPHDLRNCLTHLIKQDSLRNIQIIVVDNNPASGLTAPVVNEFPEVILINESRKGLSFARNAGIRSSLGQIILTTDDDVTVPPDWVENTVAPFCNDKVMAVAGNVLPVELENEAQHHFENYGGLGRGFRRLEVDKKWFESFKKRAVPTWRLGACANAAFRSSIFKHPEIGLFRETLGAGTPTGCSEDSYLMYKILKANFNIIYEPTSFVWHKHRQSMTLFRRQIYNYSKGHVAHHLITAFHDNDYRGLYRIFVELPLNYFKRIKNSILHKNSYPLSMIFLEIAGTFMGPWALLRSILHLKRQQRKSADLLPSENFRLRQKVI